MALALALAATGCIAGLTSCTEKTALSMRILSMRILYSNWIPLPTIRCCLYLKKRMR